MALIIKTVYNFYHHIFTDLKDPRSKDYILIGDSPLPFLTILAGYAALCKFGPKIMESRKPYDLKNAMILYNFLQVFGNTFFGLRALKSLIFDVPFNLICQPIDYSSSAHGMEEVWFAHLYFMFKLIDLFDTLFIILKKKNSQLSFLHCYHHFGIFAGSYVMCKWIPGGSATVLGLINTFVHSIMYFYYFLTAFKPELKKSIWWKRYITQIQIAQFAFCTYVYLRNSLAADCNYPKTFAWMLFIQNIFMLTLFTDFYVKVYRKSSEKLS